MILRQFLSTSIIITESLIKGISNHVYILILRTLSGQGIIYSIITSSLTRLQTSWTLPLLNCLQMPFEKVTMWELVTIMTTAAETTLVVLLLLLIKSKTTEGYHHEKRRSTTRARRKHRNNLEMLWLPFIGHSQKKQIQSDSHLLHCEHDLLEVFSEY